MPIDDLTIARELGSISAHLQAQGEQLARIEAHAIATNGRVKRHDIDIAVLKDRDERDQDERMSLQEQIRELHGRGRNWWIGIGGPVLASLVLVLTGHA